MSEQAEWNPITTAALKQVRKSLAALLLELPEEVWRGHKGIVETAISQMVQDQLAMREERDRYHAALVEVRQTLRAWNRSAWDGNDIIDEDTPAVVAVIDEALEAGAARRRA